MRIIAAKDYNDMSRKAANIISAQVILKPDCVLGLATGSSPIGTYKQLIEWYKKGDLDFSQVKTANLDEYRGLPKSNDQSYDYFMKDNFFNHININFDNLHIPDGEEPDAEKACADYDRIVAELGGVDLQLLGMGHNGHIGFNEPSDVFAKSICRRAPSRQTSASSLPSMRFRVRLIPWVSAPSCRLRRS